MSGSYSKRLQQSDGNEVVLLKDIPFVELETNQHNATQKIPCFVSKQRPKNNNTTL
jgi:hypothetical protein